MNGGYFFRGLILVILISIMSYKNAFGSNLQEQLTYLYFFSAITLTFFYRKRKMN